MLLIVDNADEGSCDRDNFAIEGLREGGAELDALDSGSGCVNFEGPGCKGSVCGNIMSS